MKLGFLFVFWLMATFAFAQEKTVQGLVFDKTTKERIAKVNLRNLRSGQSVYNNLKAEFTINVKIGDALVVSKFGYFTDTLTIQNYNDLAVYLKASSIVLKEVNVRDTVISAKKKLEQTQREYSKIYGSLNHRDLLSISPGAGAGISIDAIWNMISKSGRNAEHLRQIIEQDYRTNVVDQRFNKTLVQQVTGLKEPQLTSFMTRYRPSYYLVTTASDYEFVTYIKSNVKRFMRNPNARALQQLQQLQPE